MYGRHTGGRGGIDDRLARLDSLATWPSRTGPGFTVPTGPDQIRAQLAALVDAATLRYLLYGHGTSVMLVHSVTAPNALLRALPVLDAPLWAPSLSAAWAATSALTTVYASKESAPREQLPEPPAGRESCEDVARDTFACAAEHGGEHVTKFADTAVEVFARTGHPDAIAAVLRAVE